MRPQLHDVIPYHESHLQTTISSRENLSHCKPTLTTLSHPKKIQTDQHINTRSNHSVWPSPKNSLTDMRVKHLFLPTPRKLNEKQEATTHCCEVMKRNTRDAHIQCNTQLPFQWHTQAVSHAQLDPFQLQTGSHHCTVHLVLPIWVKPAFSNTKSDHIKSNHNKSQ